MRLVSVVRYWYRQYATDIGSMLLVTPVTVLLLLLPSDEPLCVPSPMDLNMLQLLIVDFTSVVVVVLSVGINPAAGRC